MKYFTIAVVIAAAALSGCAVSLHGRQTSGGGATTTTTGSSVQGSTRVGHARLGGAFGAPPAANAPGGQVTLSRGASAVLVLGLVIAGAADTVGQWFKPTAGSTAGSREPLSPGGISHTCSCYGWQPELTADPAAQ